MKFKEQLEIIKELNQKGLTDSAIARLINRSNSVVNRNRNLLKLPRNWEKRSYKSEYDKLRGYIIRNTKFMAKRRNLDFNLDFRDFELPEYCPLLDIKLTYHKESGGNDLTHATLDRIDNSKGYIKGNVWVISRLANNMKSCANFEQLEKFSKNIITTINNIKNQDARGNITNCSSLDS